jgi:hypothetical protein
MNSFRHTTIVVCITLVSAFAVLHSFSPLEDSQVLASGTDSVSETIPVEVDNSEIIPVELVPVVAVPAPAPAPVVETPAPVVETAIPVEIPVAVLPPILSENPPVVYAPTPTPKMEDDPDWDCRWDGNQICGTTIYGESYLIQFEDGSPIAVWFSDNQAASY